MVIGCQFILPQKVPISYEVCGKEKVKALKEGKWEFNVTVGVDKDNIEILK